MRRGIELPRVRVSFSSAGAWNRRVSESGAHGSHCGQSGATGLTRTLARGCHTGSLTRYRTYR